MGGWTGRDRDRVLWDGIISINGTPNEPKDLVTKEYVDDADGLKVPYTGATTDVDLGSNTLNIGSDSVADEGTITFLNSPYAINPGNYIEYQKGLSTHGNVCTVRVDGSTMNLTIYNSAGANYGLKVYGGGGAVNPRIEPQNSAGNMDIGQVSNPFNIIYAKEIYTTGDVGIGTTSPSKELDVNGSVNISGNLEFSDGSASIIGSSAYDAGDITLKTSDSFAGAPGKITLVSSNYEDTIPGGDISIYSESTGVGVGDVLLQEKGGYVGIGTTSPSVDLEIGTSGGAETSLRLNSDDAGNYIQIDSVGNVGRIKLTGSSNFIMSSEGAAGYMSIFTNNAERYRFTKALALGRNYKGTAYYNVPEDGLIVEGDVGIGTTSPDTKLQVVGTTKLGDDNTNYSTFETTGFMEATGTAKAYRDINMAGYLLTRPASSAPDVVSFLDESGTDTTIETYGFDVDEKVHGGFELQHDYAEGTDLVFHVHWQGITAPSGTDNVQWRLNYIVMRDGETLDAAVTIDSPDTPFDTQYETVRSDFTAITGTNFKIGDQFMFTLTRVTATGDAYAGDALIATAGIHYQVNTIGSRTITVK